MLRESYTTKARLFRNSSAEVDITWVPCQPGVPTLDIESPIASLQWHKFPWEKTGVGEVFNAPVVIHKPVPIAGADGHKVCGTVQDFEQGGLYDPTAPPMTYTPEGLALCCGADPGGLELGGEEPDPPAYCAEYIGGNGLAVMAQTLSGGPYRWFKPTTGTATHELQAPEYTGTPYLWRYIVLGSTVYEPVAGSFWTGQGSCNFIKVSGPGPIFDTVACWS